MVTNDKLQSYERSALNITKSVIEIPLIKRVIPLIDHISSKVVHVLIVCSCLYIGLNSEENADSTKDGSRAGHWVSLIQSWTFGVHNCLFDAKSI